MPEPGLGGRGSLVDVDLKRQRLLRAFGNASKRFPLLGRSKFKVQPGEGPHFAEVFPSDERLNPNPGIHTIEVRNKAFDTMDDQGLESLIAGEFLHLAPLVDPGFKALRDAFRGSLSERQMDFLRKRHDFFRKRGGGDDRPFEQAFSIAGLDEIIRSRLFPELGGDFEDEFFSPVQRKLLDVMKNRLAQ